MCWLRSWNGLTLAVPGRDMLTETGRISLRTLGMIT